MYTYNRENLVFECGYLVRFLGWRKLKKRVEFYFEQAQVELIYNSTYSFVLIQINALSIRDIYIFESILLTAIAVILGFLFIFFSNKNISRLS